MTVDPSICRHVHQREVIEHDDSPQRVIKRTYWKCVRCGTVVREIGKEWQKQPTKERK